MPFAAGLGAFAAGLAAGFAALALLAAGLSFELGAGLAATFALAAAAGFSVFLGLAEAAALADGLAELSFALMRAERLAMMTFLVWADFKPLSSPPKTGPERVSANYDTEIW